MNSQDVGPLCKTFLGQIRGIFAGIEKLPAAFEELERREMACESREAVLRNLDQATIEKEQCCQDHDAAIQAKQTELGRLHHTIGEKLAFEELRQREKMERRLAPLRAELDAVTLELREKKDMLAKLKV